MSDSPYSLRSSVFLALALLSLASCAMDEDYAKPDVALPPSWVSDDAQAMAAKAEMDQSWWENFNDPVLTQLINKAAADNLDLKIAEARIAQARAGQSSAEADLLPAGDFKASAMRQANQMALPGGMQADLMRKPFNIFQSGFDASWEMDLFGGNRRAEEAAEAEVQASEASRDDARISLLAEVARTYVVLRKAQAQAGIAKNVVDADRKMLEIMKQRNGAGQAARLDVTKAEARLEQDETQVPVLRNQVAQAEYSLDVLLGQQPGFARKVTAEPRPIPLSDKTLILAAPASVMAARPDIRMAERKLASATAQRGVALAQFFPKISLSGFFGVLNSSTDKLLSAQNKSWAAAGEIFWPILSYNSLSANLDAANAKAQEAMTVYQKAIVGALSDVERSFSSYTARQEFLQSTANDFEKNNQIRSVAEERYREGATSRLELLDADRLYYSAQSRLLAARADVTQDSIALYKSLGGGWRRAE